MNLPVEWSEIPQRGPRTSREFQHRCSQPSFQSVLRFLTTVDAKYFIVIQSLQSIKRELQILEISIQHRWPKLIT